MFSNTPFAGAPIAALSETGAVTGVMSATEAGLDVFVSVGLVLEAKSYKKKRKTVDHGPTDQEIIRADIARLRQIEQEDEAILAVIVAATKVMGGHGLWHR